MNDQRQQALAAIATMLETTEILLGHLRSEDEEKSHEAISVMLTQALDMYGADSVAFKQFFPVMDTIQKRIANSNISGALRQSELFRTQLDEINDLIIRSET